VREGPRWSRASGRRELKSTAGVAQADGSIERAAPDTRVRGFGCYFVWYWVGWNPQTPLSLVWVHSIKLMLAPRATGCFVARCFCLYPFH
jgi:hypothetical protein